MENNAEIDILKKILLKLQKRETPNQAAKKHLEAIRASSHKETLKASSADRWQVNNEASCCIIT